jgi:hypothetical protein
MGLFDIFKKQTPVDLEAQRREYLARNGRITDGTIIENSDEIDETENSVVSYVYSVHGANYESSEILSDEKLADSLKYAPGAKVGVKYDPKHHGNSILV